jgi:hypothetical protein
MTCRSKRTGDVCLDAGPAPARLAIAVVADRPVGEQDAAFGIIDISTSSATTTWQRSQ